MTGYEPWVGPNQSKLAWDVMTGYEPWVGPNQSKLAWDVMTGYEPWVGLNQLDPDSQQQSALWTFPEDSSPVNFER